MSTTRVFDREVKLEICGSEPIKILEDNKPRETICRVPGYDKSGNPARTQHGQESRRYLQGDRRETKPSQVYTLAGKQRRRE